MAESQALVEEIVGLRQRQDRLNARVDSIQGRPASDAELRAMVDYQARADEVYKSLDLVGAPGPFGNESAGGYRKRLLAGLQPYSRTWRDARLDAIDAAQLGPFEDAVYKEASELAASNWSPRGRFHLREVKVPDRAGRTWTEFKGQPIAWMQNFMGAEQYLKRIKRGPGAQ